ncbi:LysE family translocator [Sporomusa termitida]|uniref:2A76: homoserine/Threonine efflux protein n=1 Tax=Sporomusa termitida TaxID=2377 RepID=A0A517E1A9_9FIRM|nr:LysE family translocator [Sporomusa termitida]QDR83389.1 2A76: homoserine/Threonine efflux protein [Sporomusa termitida]
MPFSPREIYSFIGVVALLVCLPGPNTILVMQSAGVNGRRAGIYIVCGIATAVYCNALLSGLGLSLIIMQSVELYTLLKLCGAAYIAGMGIMSLADAYRLHRQPLANVRSADCQSVVNSGKSRLACYSQGLLTGILNPKAVLFFIMFFPQFIHPENNVALQYLILAVLYSLVAVAWYGLLVLGMEKLRPLIAASAVQKWLKTLTGALLLGMGLKIAQQK